MSLSKAKLKLQVGRGTVEVDGQEIEGVRELSIDAGVGEIPTLRLDLLVHEIEVDGEMIVSVPDSTREALIKLDWTPPSE